MTLPDKHIRRSGDDYAVALSRLLPQGRAWPREATSVLYKVLTGLTKTWGDRSDGVDHRAADLLEIESDPSKTSEMLSDWERAFGLPDECLPVPPSTESGRRGELIHRMTFKGAQSRQFFYDLATRLNAQVDIEEYAPYLCGYSRVGNTKALYDNHHFRWECGPDNIRTHWTVTLYHTLTGVECTFRRYKPAHTELVFKYVNTIDRVASMYAFLGI